jgi:hypothetical protein
MDNKLNEIRRKISRLRAEMLLLQDDIRVMVNHDLDCSDASIRLMAMRVEMVRLIQQRNAMGGIEACPNIAQRLKEHYRPELRRKTSQSKTLQNKTLQNKSLQDKTFQDKTAIAKEKPGRSRVQSA